MDQPDLLITAQAWAHEVLVWVGFGTLVGLLAKAIMPGRDPGGTVATLAMGISGTVIGCGVLMYLWDGQRVSPISPLGFVVGTAGAFILLFFYRLLAGRVIAHDELARPPHFLVRRSTARGRRRTDLDHVEVVDHD